MIASSRPPSRSVPRRLKEVSLLEAPAHLMRSIRGLSSHTSLTWLACVPLALLVLGVFNLSARAAELPELTAAFLVNNLWIAIAAFLVIFMNAGFAMVEAGLCRQKNAVNILSKNLIVFALAVTAYWFIGYSLMYGDSIAGGNADALHHHRKADLLIVDHPELATDLGAGDCVLPQMDEEARKIFGDDEASERLTGERSPIGGEHVLARRVDFKDLAAGIEGEAARRKEFEEALVVFKAFGVALIGGPQLNALLP
jgi:hypothetical protein